MYVHRVANHIIMFAYHTHCVYLAYVNARTISNIRVLEIRAGSILYFDIVTDAYVSVCGVIQYAHEVCKSSEPLLDP